MYILEFAKSKKSLSDADIRALHLEGLLDTFSDEDGQGNDCLPSEDDGETNEIISATQSLDTRH